MAPRTRATPNIRSFFQAPSATQDRTTPTSSQKRVAQRKHTQTGATPSADSSAADMAEKIILDPRGDVVLLAGSPPTHSVTVSFACIAAASPVFTALLSGPFSEGQVKRSIEQPQQVALPEDDAQAISDICHLLYHQVTDLQDASPLSAERLYQLIKTADKYDCLGVLRFQVCALAQAHFDHPDSKPTCGELVLRTAAAYLLDEPKYFRIATTQLVTCSNEPLSACRKLEGGEILSGGALLIMSEQRSKAHRAIISGLCDGEFCGLCEDGVASFEYREELERTFNTTSWPPSSEKDWKTIAEMLEGMRKTKYLSCGAGCRRVDFLELAEEVEGICKGLCIVCAKEDQLDLDDGKCKHKGKGKGK